MIGHAYLKLYPYVVACLFISSMHVYIRNQTEEAEWMVPQYREESSFIPNTVSQRRDEKPHTTGLDDTAIPHIKIKITEITLEKELNTGNPHVPLLY